MFSFVAFEKNLKKNKCETLNFLNNFMPNTINLNFFFFVNKVLKQFGGSKIGALP
jgi:hypothetical protein